MKLLIFLACVSLACAFSPGRLLRGPRNFIVGGVESPVGSRPYQVALFDGPASANNQFCGGTLVHPQWVVTAAHCAGSGKVNVGLGFHDLNENGNQVIAGSWIVHPNFNYNTLNKDIALIKLDAAATLSDSVQTIKLASSGSDVAASTALLVSGWGSISSGGSYPDKLRQVVVSAVSRKDCKAKYGSEASITRTMICAAASGKDSCQGDSGGPIVSNFDEGKPIDGVVLEGIVSWGFGCADPSYPGVYTRVAKFCDWIATETNNAVTC